MRVVLIILALVFAGSVRADDWKEYDNPEYSFAIHFPVDPTVEATNYGAGDGRSFQGRVFSVSKDTGTFKVTVVDMPDDKTGEELARNTKPTFVPALAGVLAAEAFAIRSLLFHAANGAVCALIGWSLTGDLRDQQFLSNPTVLVPLPGSPEASSYWLIAGWTAGFWKPLGTARAAPQKP